MNSKITHNINNVLFIIFLFFIAGFYSCEKDELKTYTLTEEEKKLILYQENDTFSLKDSNNNQYNFYVDDKIDFYFDTVDFLGVPQYKSEHGAISFRRINENKYSGGVNLNVNNEGFRYHLNIYFLNNSFEIIYNKENYKLKNVDQMVIDETTYHDVYIFNNATSETAEPTQKIYLNTEYGFLKLEDLEKDVVYTIVRE